MNEEREKNEREDLWGKVGQIEDFVTTTIPGLEGLWGLMILKGLMDYWIYVNLNAEQLSTAQKLFLDDGKDDNVFIDIVRHVQQGNWHLLGDFNDMSNVIEDFYGIHESHEEADYGIEWDTLDDLFED